MRDATRANATWLCFYRVQDLTTSVWAWFNTSTPTAPVVVNNYTYCQVSGLTNGPHM